MFFCHITQNNEKMYFCNEEHFQLMNNNNLKKEELIHFINDATGANTYSKRVQSSALKYINAYENNGMLESLHYIVKVQRHQIRQYLDTISFSNDNAKLKYLFVMIHDNVKEEKLKREQAEKQQKNIRNIELIDVVETKTVKRKGRGISEFL